MNCQTLASILDDRAERDLTAAERCELDAHLAACADCARAWDAHAALLAQTIPPLRVDFLDDVLRVIAAQPAASPRRRHPLRFALGCAALAAGAALAAITVVRQSWDGPPGAVLASAPAVDAAPQTTAADGAPPPSTAAAGTLPSTSTADLDDPVSFPDGDYFTLLMMPPQYPLDALKDGREASVELRYTITNTGTVADVTVVKSTDSSFDTSAIVALEQWKFMPRVVSGKRVDSPAIHTVIRFQLTGAPPSVPSPSDRPGIQELLTPAWECVATRDLQCAQQVLDEVSATYTLLPYEQYHVLTFYGYLYTQFEDYERAIDAYEKAGLATGNSTLLTLAHLYFTRQQYQPALDTALEHLTVMQEKSAQPNPRVTQFIDKLLQLGITPSVR